MSWFANSLSLSLPSSPRQGRGNNKEEDEEEEGEGEESDVGQHAAAGKGVKEDLSELTKSLTRQLWGVASFLNPPPALEKSSMSPKAILVPQTDVGILKKIGQDKEEGNDAEAESDAKDPTSHLSIAGVSAMDEGSGILSSSKTSSPNSGGQRLTGFHSDLADLRGTVATGISRIQSVIRSVTGDDEDEAGAAETSPEERKYGDRESPADHGPSNSGFNSLFKPLLDGMLSRERPPQTDGSDGSTWRPLASLVRDEEEDKYEQHPEDSHPSVLASGFDELSKFASSLLPFARDMVGEFSDGEYAVGVTEDVVAFANTIAMHPETWLDFPLADEDEDEDDDFEMTEAQQEHANAVKHEAATLGALYTELCPNIISNGRFWQIYFVLLHSRLSKQDADLLSTPQIIRFRGLLQQLQDKEVAMGRSPAQSGEEELVAESLDVGNSSNKQQIVESDMEYITKNLVTTDAHSIARQDSLADAQKREQLLETNSAKSAALRLVDDETEVNEWLENSDDEKADGKAAIQGTVPQEQTNSGGMENADEDVSFSDLEDNEEETNQRKGISNDPSPEKELPGDATPGSTSERVEFNDWFTVNEEDVASAVLSP
jgi:hypothetical protein